MGRKPGFKHSPDVRAKIGAGVKISRGRSIDNFFIFKITTDKGIFFGTVEAEIEEQAELRAKKAMEILGLSILNLERRKRSPASGDNTFLMPLKGTNIFAG